MKQPNLAGMGDQDYTQPFTFECNVMPSVDEEGFGDTELHKEGWVLRFGCPWCVLGCGWSGLADEIESLHTFGAFDDVEDWHIENTGSTLYVFFKTEAAARQFCDNINKII